MPHLHKSQSNVRPSIMLNALSTFTENPFVNAIWEQVAIWGPKIILAGITFVVGWKIADCVGRLVEKAIDRRHIDPTLKPFISSLITMLIKVGVVVSAITTAGVEATSFAAIFAAMGLAIGMALSGTLQNFAGGVVLLVIRPFKVGDVIEAQGFTGTVEAIQIFQTILLTPDNKMIHIPNGKLQNDSLINYSTKPTRRVDFSFSIGYGEDVDKAREVILAVIHSIPQIHGNPEPFIQLGMLADSSVNITVRVWANNADYWDVHFSMLEQVKKALDAAGIRIPCPQRNIFIHQAP